MLEEDGMKYPLVRACGGGMCELRLNFPLTWAGLSVEGSTIGYG